MGWRVSDGRCGAVEQLLDHRVVQPADGEGPQEPPADVAGLCNDEMPYETTLFAAIEDLEGVGADEWHGRREGEFDGASGFVGGTGVADAAVSAVGADLQRPIQEQGGPVGGGPERISGVGYSVEKGSDLPRGDR
ncbi:hypothetical protein ACFYUD_00200 [Nocardia tengchongensis]|uniref:hypothetical protein n=1 Tax=Nocardia tengchongensis TaxID=2055889 RepID=UPI0036907E98